MPQKACKRAEGCKQVQNYTKKLNALSLKETLLLQTYALTDS